MGLFDFESNKTFFTSFSGFERKFEGQTGLEIFFLSVIVICGLTGNLLVILSTALFKHMRSTSNLLLCYQAIADLFLALHPIPIIVTRVTTNWVFGEAACRLFMYTFFITGCLTLLCMCALAIDRYFSICRPQSNNFLKSHPYLAAVLLFCLSIVLNYNNLFEWRVITTRSGGRDFKFCGREWVQEPKGTLADLFRTLTFYFLPLCIIFLMHSIVWNHVRKSARRIASVRMSVGSEAITRSSAATVRRSVQVPPQSITRTAQTKLLQMLILSVILFVLMFTPFVIVIFFALYGGGLNRSGLRAWMFATIVALSNCFVNPILIYLFNAKYRACFKALIYCRYNLRNSTVNSLVTGIVSNAAVSVAGRH